jgi:hypothetical protein
MHGTREPPRATTPGPKTGHSFSRSVSMAVGSGGDDRSGGAEGPGPMSTPTTARRTTLDRGVSSAIPAPSGLPRRQSGGLGSGLGAAGYAMNPAGRRQSGAQETAGDMRPPSARGRRLSGVGETF